MNQEDLQQRVMTVTSYVLDDDYEKIINKSRITIQPARIAFVIASFVPTLFEGEELYRVNVLFDDTMNLELFLKFLDLTMLEMATGTFFTSV